MPPEVAHFCPLVTHRTPLLSRVSPTWRLKRALHHKYCQGRMKLTKKRLIPLLVFILFSASLIFRFLNITMIANFSLPLPLAALPPVQRHDCTSACEKNVVPTNASSLTEKEMQSLFEFFSKRVPCNLLVFGNVYQYSSIASMNGGGVTVFLEDYLNFNTSTESTNNTQVHKIMYNTIASEAYQLLKHARGNPGCLPEFRLHKVSKCNLALSNLPQKVYDTMWDVVIVDGPSGSTPESPGRMASIYTASMLARRGNTNTTRVIVHDVDRMIEKWFAWEFLCEENLVSSKGRFWHFQIQGMANATAFCTS